MARIAVIGGTGLNAIAAAARPNAAVGGAPVVGSTEEVATPYGDASAPLQTRPCGAHELVFLARHGQPHRIAPHAINYRANLWLLKQASVDAVLAVNAVGGIHRSFTAGEIVVPHQIIDYTWGRESSYSDATALVHIDFSHPYDGPWRERLMRAGRVGGGQVQDFGVYGCTQGPRLESVAEVDRLERDGCDLVGMTAMPEACLARELGLPYAAVCLVVNPAAGRGNGLIEHEAIGAVIAEGMSRVEQMVLRAIRDI